MSRGATLKVLLANFSLLPVACTFGVALCSNVPSYPACSALRKNRARLPTLTPQPPLSENSALSDFSLPLGLTQLPLPGNRTPSPPRYRSLYVSISFSVLPHSTLPPHDPLILPSSSIISHSFLPHSPSISCPSLPTKTA